LIYGSLFHQVEPPRHILIMEHCRGDLHTYITKKESPISLSLKAKICDQISSGMYYLQELDVHHLDLNPSNILLSDALLHAKITDFEFMKVNKNGDFTHRALPEYASPEVLKGSFTKTSDVFSFGLVQYFIFTEKEPFSSLTGGVENPEEKRKKLTAHYESKDQDLAIHHEELENHLSHYSQDIRTLLCDKEGPILKCLSKDENSRCGFDHFSPEETTTFFHDLLIPKPQKEDDKRSTDVVVAKLEDDIYPAKNGDTMEFAAFIEKVKEHLNEDNHIDNEEDICRKYLYLKLAKNPKMKTYYQPNTNLPISREKFLHFFNLHGPALISLERPNPIQQLSDKLFSKDWYHENIPNTGALLQKENSKSKKKILSFFAMEMVQMNLTNLY